MLVKKMMKKRVAVAMSGGVDSSLTAHILQERGYEVFGATMRLSAESDESVRDAQAVAADLGIEHYVFDFADIFSEKVIDYFLNEYRNGRTPNPCVECNRYLKFAAFWKKAEERGADLMATGHYIRMKEINGNFIVLKGIDEQKDQSYMVYHLGQKQLRRCLFLLGEYTKAEVRSLALKYGIRTADKPESQDICFIPDGNTQKYLMNRMPKLSKRGKIVTQHGEVLGEHNGAAFYTVGQRRGLGVAYSEPLFVTDVNIGENEVIVGTAEEVYSNGLEAGCVSWLSDDLFDGRRRADVKIRYSKSSAPAEIVELGGGRVKVTFFEPQRAITPGQSAVFYDGERLLGGGIIERCLK